MLKLVKQRNGHYTEQSVFFINCYKLKYGYSLASDAIAHIERDNKHEQAMVSAVRNNSSDMGILAY